MEILDQKPSFRDSFRKRRCLIVADGFYEWKIDPDKSNKKTRYYFQLPDKAPFAFAGLWDTWQKYYHGCSIITRDAVEEVRDIHDRMPCVLKPEGYADWLDPGNQDIHGVMEMLQQECLLEFIPSPM